MIDTKITSIHEISVHKIGNKASDTGLFLSKNPLVLDINTKNILSEYFLSAFKSEEYYSFYHEIDVKMNDVYSCANKIFENPETLFKQSVIMANLLFDKTNDKKIKEGEFYTVYFTNIHFKNQMIDAVGLFKSENKDTFLTIDINEDGLDIGSESGINVKKLDKGCLILNIEPENGYIISIVNNSNKDSEQYWIDEFLQLIQRKDDCYNTQNMISICKTFVENELPKQFEVSKIDQIDLLNKSAKFFKEKDKFNIENFENEVMAQQEVINSFQNYKNLLQQEAVLDVANDFNISDYAVKKQARIFKSIIKLDKNFHIYIHGNREKIERGNDDNGKFYKIYYKEEE
ncbi:MAG: nucleoid-associated protein [Bacteroidales bacterium]|jgi:hypothetical protein|nr:nucleoid-associated protein [Bacteroidales bacterium]